MSGKNIPSAWITSILAVTLTAMTVSYWHNGFRRKSALSDGWRVGVQPQQAPDSFLPNPVPIPEFPNGVDWINSSSRLTLNDLRGKLVLLDFWTYCCINCMHVLPVLEQAEKKYERELVVIGVHTPKFDGEKDTQNVRDAILRYEIKHPVLNDAEEILWRKLGVATWPTLVLVDPEGRAIWAHAGEIAFQELDRVLTRAVERYSAQGRLDARPVRFELAVDKLPETPLRFPGKITIDNAGGRLAIADSNHNRIVLTETSGNLISVIGSGTAGRRDGNFEDSQFNHPQGLAFQGDQLYVADTENHLIRRIDLATKTVTTVAGTGNQTRNPWQHLDHSQPLSIQDLNRLPLQTDLGSPWDVLVHGNQLYIAMAGPHQIWAMHLDGKSIRVYAGSGREDIIDGPLLPRSQFSARSSTFAQPSGLATDGKRLFVADSEGSSIRLVPFEPDGMVSTVVGTAQLFDRRLFTFGFKDGPFDQVLMQHPLGVAYQSQRLYVADTYNNSIRIVDLAAGNVQTLVGDAQSAGSGEPTTLDEPGGLCVFEDQLYIADTNHHSVRVYNLKERELRTLTISGLQPPSKPKNPSDSVGIPALPAGVKQRSAAELVLRKSQTDLVMNVEFQLPRGWKLNPLAPLRYVAIWNSAAKTVFAESMSGKFEPASNPATATLKVPQGEVTRLQIGLTYYICRTDGQGLCLADGAVVEIPIRQSKDANDGVLTIRQPIQVKLR